MDRGAFVGATAGPVRPALITRRSLGEGLVFEFVERFGEEPVAQTRDLVAEAGEPRRADVCPLFLLTNSKYQRRMTTPCLRLFP